MAAVTPQQAAPRVGTTMSHAGIYAFGNIVRYISSFLLLPIYTRHLTPADYGVLELLSMITDLAAIILGLRLGEAIFRFYSRASTAAEKAAVMSTALLLTAIAFAGGVVALYTFATPVSSLVFGSDLYARFLQQFSIILFLQMLAEVPLALIRAQHRAWLFVGFSLLKLVLQVSLNVYFVVFLDMGVQGVIYGGLITAGIYGPLLAVYAIRHTGLRFAPSLARRLIVFSLPLALADIGAFYLTFGDRYFLRVFSDLSEIGIYALAYKFGFILMYFTWSPFQLVWDVHKYEVHGMAEAKRVYQRNFLIITFIMIFAGVGMAVFVRDILHIMSAAPFWPAADIVPIILLAYIIQGWTTYSSLGLMLAGKTVQMTLGSVVAAIVITVGYVTLIPAFGAMGAAWATLIAFAARLIWVHEHARREYDMELPWGKALPMMALAIAAYFASAVVPLAGLSGIAWKIVVVALFLGGFFVLPFFSPPQKRALIAALRNPRRAGGMLG